MAMLYSSSFAIYLVAAVMLLLVVGLLSSAEAFVPFGRHPHQPPCSRQLLRPSPSSFSPTSSSTSSVSSPPLFTLLRAGGNGGNSEGDDYLRYEYDEGFDDYARDLDPREARSQVDRENREYAIVDRTPLWMRTVRYPYRLAKKFLPEIKIKPGKLILLRCGESTWNANQTFTGWADPDLTDKGLRECEHAARLLLSEGYQPDIVYTSRLKRSVRSTWTLLEELNSLYLPVYKSWRLNERSYGALTGLSKTETARRFGSNVVQAWRNSLKARPPPMKRTDPYYPGNDDRYSDLSRDQIPLSESLLDTMNRAVPLWEYKIRYDIENGKNVLVVAHGNTLRGLIKTIDGIGDQDIEKVILPAGIPFVYRFDEDLDPAKPPDGSLTQVHTNGKFLEKPGLLQEALKLQTEWRSGGFVSVKTDKKRTTNVEDSLLLLRQEQAALLDLDTDEDNDINGLPGVSLVESSSSSTRDAALENTFDDPSEFEDFDEKVVGEATTTGESGVAANVVPLADDGGENRSNQRDDQVVVFIRHGRTPHNNLGLFTGWEDPPLAPDGVEDAKNAGRLLRRHGFKFDVVYSSWLQRALQTAWYVIDELDMLHLPLIKSWRLNERMYGALTGKSKAMVANEYGEEQLIKWRRGFKIRPPPVSSYSLSYPGNDYSRTKYVKDLRVSWSETINRSWEERKFRIHRKFPKHESLHDCMQRSIPYYTDRIMKEAVSKGDRVLITSHENAIRGILMHLCGIPEEAMNKLHLPNGVPFVYSVKGKCITLLDDGSGMDPMKVYDFGPAATYLFKPCEIDDDFYEDMATKVESPKKKVEA